MIRNLLRRFGRKTETTTATVTVTVTPDTSEFVDALLRAQEASRRARFRERIAYERAVAKAHLSLLVHDIYQDLGLSRYCGVVVKGPRG